MATSRELREKANNLISKKDDIELEIKTLQDVLTTQKNVGMDGALIDAEGYPRNDIDVYAVRTARHKIICLQNDHAALMTQIEGALHELHASERVAAPSAPHDNGSKAVELPTTFALVDLVSTASPAEKAGLLVGDRIVEFGSISADNFGSMRDIGSLVQHSKGKAIRVVVLRETEVTNLSLTPAVWDGRGLLGCNIVPLK